MMRILRVLMGIALLACDGCSAGMKGPNDSGGITDSGDINTPDSNSDTGLGPPQEAGWWSLDAAFDLVAGLPSEKGALLSFTVLSDEKPPAPICNESAPLARAPTLRTSPDSIIWHWWNVEPGKGDGGCSETSFSTTDSILLGIGDLHPELAALLAKAGYGDATASLYGAYLSLDDGTNVWVYGVAGTDADFKALGPRVEQAPVPDGAYRIEGLYLLPLPSEEEAGDREPAYQSRVASPE